MSTEPSLLSHTFLTKEGAEFLDLSGKLSSGIPICPPEGDAGTGMAATNSVLPKTGNVSAGTSVFAMLVMENQLKNIYPQIDIVTTPDSSPVAMVHCNNCCNELDTWVNIFGEFASLMGYSADKSALYENLYRHALTGDSTGIVAYNYLSGEHVSEIEKGRPMYFRLPEVKMSLSGFMKAQLFTAFATLSMGMDILFNEEKVSADEFLAHGGLFKVQGVAQQILADALKTPVSVMETAGEGGAWGMALLAAYMMNGNGKSLGCWLDENVFGGMNISKCIPDEKNNTEFKEYMKNFKKGLSAQRESGEV